MIFFFVVKSSFLYFYKHLRNKFFWIDCFFNTNNNTKKKTDKQTKELDREDWEQHDNCYSHSVRNHSDLWSILYSSNWIEPFLIIKQEQTFYDEAHSTVHRQSKQITTNCLVEILKDISLHLSFLIHPEKTTTKERKEIVCKYK